MSCMFTVAGVHRRASAAERPAEMPRRPPREPRHDARRAAGLLPAEVRGRARVFARHRQARQADHDQAQDRQNKVCQIHCSICREFCIYACSQLLEWGYCTTVSHFLDIGLQKCKTKIQCFNATIIIMTNKDFQNQPVLIAVGAVRSCREFCIYATYMRISTCIDFCRRVPYEYLYDYY